MFKNDLAGILLMGNDGHISLNFLMGHSSLFDSAYRWGADWTCLFFSPSQIEKFFKQKPKGLWQFWGKSFTRNKRNRLDPVSAC